MPSRMVRSNIRRSLLQQSEEMKSEVTETARRLGREMQEYKKDVVANWKTKPTFVLTTEVTREGVSFTVKATGEGSDIWRYVDEGTGKYGPKKQSYKIRPKGPYPLKFQGNYSAKTKAVAAYDVGDGSRSGDWVSTYEVTHDGIEAREFTKQSRLNLKPTFKREIENAMRRGIRKARR